MKIVFIKEIIGEYAGMTAMFLAGGNKAHYEIKPASHVISTDILGVPVYSEKSLPYVKKIRKAYPHNKVVAGGIGVMYLYHYLLKHGLVDYVYFGEGFIFNDKSLIDATYTDGQEVEVEDRVPFDITPLVPINSSTYYLLIERGCPYRCEYCYVSWINKFAHIDIDRFKRIVNSLERNPKMANKQITLLGNEGYVKEQCEEFLEGCKLKYDNQSITLLKYLKHYEMYKTQRVLRFGVELPTQELRFKVLPKAKHIRDEDLLAVFDRPHPSVVQFFYIYAYLGTKPEDYRVIYDILKKRKRVYGTLRLSYTTLEVHPYTPLASRLEEHCHMLPSWPNAKEVLPPSGDVARVMNFYPQHYGRVLEKYALMYLGEARKADTLTSGDFSRMQETINRMKRTHSTIFLVK